jgi:hypothetical protein
MIVIAHHYNEQQQHSFPNLKTIAREVGCSKRWAIKLIGRLIAQGDIFRIAKGGRARGDTNIYGIAPKYLQERVNNGVHPSGEIRVNAAVHKKGEPSCARKGELLKGKTGRKVLKQKESAAAASASAGPPPPLLSETDLEDSAKFQAEFEKSRGRKLLGAK